MEIAAETQRRIKARAVGRTPEEHAALERALAVVVVVVVVIFNVVRVL